MTNESVQASRPSYRAQPSCLSQQPVAFYFVQFLLITIVSLPTLFYFYRPVHTPHKNRYVISLKYTLIYYTPSNTSNGERLEILYVLYLFEWQAFRPIFLAVVRYVTQTVAQWVSAMRRLSSDSL